MACRTSDAVSAFPLFCNSRITYGRRLRTGKIRTDNFDFKLMCFRFSNPSFHCFIRRPPDSAFATNSVSKNDRESKIKKSLSPVNTWGNKLSTGQQGIINGVRGNVGVALSLTSKNFYKIHRIAAPDGTKFVFKEKTEPRGGSGFRM